MKSRRGTAFRLSLFAGVIVFMTSCHRITGCMDPSANNFNPEADREGDCLYDAQINFGLTDAAKAYIESKEYELCQWIVDVEGKGIKTSLALYPLVIFEWKDISADFNIHLTHSADTHWLGGATVLVEAGKTKVHLLDTFW